jgi:hypothetical protein
MVHNKNHKKGGWKKLATHRDKSNTDFVGCKGRMEGYFGNDGYWFRIKQCHTCNKGGGTAHARDHQTKIQMISPAPSWHITRDKMRRMRLVLEGCPKNYGNFPEEGPSRQWLKEIGDP